MNKKDNIIIVKLFFSITVIMMLLICGITTVLSLIGSTYYEPYMPNETPSYKNDSMFITLLGSVVYSVIAVVIMNWKLFRGVSRNIVSSITSILALVISLLFIWIFNCGVVSDALAVNNAAEQFIKGDFISYLSQDYFKAYPHQIHMAFYFIIVYRLFGMDNYIAFQIINAICVAITVFLLQESAYLITNDEGVGKCAGMLSLLLFPLFFYSTYIYGDVPGYTLAIVGTYMTIQYMKYEKNRYIVGASIMFCIACIVKENVLIFLVANAIILILFAIYKRKWKHILVALLICSVSQLGILLIDTYCMNKANVNSLPKGAPRESWIAMGMEEGICGAGGFNGEFWQVEKAYDYQYDLVKADRQSKIKDNLYYFVNNPKVAIKFYYKKYILQWNDPSFSALINVEWTSRHRERTKLADFILFGNGRGYLSELLNISHFIIFLFATIGICKYIKSWSLEGALILLIVLGGILFHELLWEVKGRYALFYYVLLIPFSSMGLESCFGKIENLCKTKKD